MRKFHILPSEKGTQHISGLKEEFSFPFPATSTLLTPFVTTPFFLLQKGTDAIKA